MRSALKSDLFSICLIFEDLLSFFENSNFERRIARSNGQCANKSSLFIIEFVYNNVTHFFTNIFFKYDYYLKIHYVIENDFIEKKIFFAKNKIKYVYDVKKTLLKRLKHVVAKQTKYCN